MANIYADAKKDMDFLLRNMGKVTQPKIECDDGAGYYHVTYFRPEGYVHKGKGEYGFWEFDLREFKAKHSNKEPELTMLDLTLENTIKRVMKRYDSISRASNKASYDKKFVEAQINKTQDIMVAISAHRVLLPLIKKFLETCTRKENYGDDLHDFWLYTQDPKKYSKQPGFVEKRVKSPYGGYCLVRAKPDIDDKVIAKKLGFKSFPLSLYAFERVPSAWWTNPKDTIPDVRRMVEECVLVKSDEKPVLRHFIELSLFD